MSNEKVKIFLIYFLWCIVYFKLDIWCVKIIDLFLLFKNILLNRMDYKDYFLIFVWFFWFLNVLIYIVNNCIKINFIYFVLII